MNALHELLNRRWIVRAKDKELYYKLKDASGAYRKFLNEKLGYQLVVNPRIIKVVKLPGLAEPWMGISQFEHTMEYRILCWILIFLEDKEPDEQFLLSQLCEFLQMQTTGDMLDWTLTKHRKWLVTVMKFCIEQGMIDIYDGSEESFSRSQDSEALFGNLGTSKYFMRSFSQDIMSYQTPKDFERSDWIDVDETRGIVRRNRVYRRLAMSMGVYRAQEEDADFDYIKNQRSLIEHDFKQYFDCHLDVHLSSAYLIVSSEDVFGKAFPANNTESDTMLLWNTIMRKNMKSSEVTKKSYESFSLSKEELYASIENMRKEYGRYFTKFYREMTTKTFDETVERSLSHHGWIRWHPITNRYIVYPIIAKINGIMIERAEEL